MNDEYKLSPFIPEVPVFLTSSRALPIMDHSKFINGFQFYSAC